MALSKTLPSFNRRVFQIEVISGKNRLVKISCRDFDQSFLPTPGPRATGFHEIHYGFAFVLHRSTQGVRS